MIKVNDTVIPRQYPELKSKVKKIGRDFNNEPLYILKNGCMYTKHELQ